MNRRPAAYRQGVPRGDAFVWNFLYKVGPTPEARTPYDLTGCSARLTVRRGWTVRNGRVVEDALADAVLAELTSGPGGGIELTADGTTGRVRCTIAAAVTATFPLIDEEPARGTASGTHKYDFELTYADGTRQTKASGELVVWETQSR